MHQWIDVRQSTRFDSRFSLRKSRKCSQPSQSKRLQMGSLKTLLAFSMTTAYSTNLLAAEFEKFDPPQTYYVIADEAQTLAGPDKATYITGTLKRGDAVEVFSMTDAAWMAIRPPAQQFDWVAAQYAHLLPGGHVAEIIDQATPAWIHSQSVELDKFQWQMKLRPTQQVTVRGQFSQALPNEQSRAWYKIDPPPGEFRYVQASQLATSPPRLQSKQVARLPGSKDASQLESFPSSKTASKTDFNVQQASGTVVQLTSEPVVLAPGETIVGGAIDDSAMLVQDGYTIGSGVGQSILVNDGSFIDEGYVEGEYFDGEILDSGAACGCAGGCDLCTSELDMTRYRLRPIARILGLVGLSLVEADRDPTMMPCHSCGRVGCTTCVGQNGNPVSAMRAANIGSLPSRLDGLPRPDRQVAQSDVDRNVLIDRIGSARERLRDSIQDVREDLTLSQPGSSDSLFGHAPVSMGKPANANKHSLLKDSDSWQGLPQKGVPTGNLELDVQGPSSLPSSWHNQTDNPDLSSKDWRAAEADSYRSELASHTSGEVRTEDNFESNELNFSSSLLRSASAELTSIVSRPTEQWQLNPLREQVAAWIEQGSDPIARGEARLLLEKINKFDEFRMRWLRANSHSIAANVDPSLEVQRAGYQSVAVGSSLRVEPAAWMQSASKATAADVIAAADASGWLVAVHGQRDDFPKFALTDDDGRLVAYVESMPGLNLRGYLQQPVAIHGEKGMHAVLNMRTIMAQQVVRVAVQ